jgi:D-alanine-D-alanine ligase
MKRESAALIPSVDEEQGALLLSGQQSSEKSTLNNFNDEYAEWDTEETIIAVRDALEERHKVHLIEADKEAYEKFTALRPDIVFNIAEGFNGPSREAQIPAMLEMLGMRYTGSDPLTLGICLDKARTKEILTYNNIPTAKFLVAESLNDVHPFPLTLPCIVKPLHEGSSKGIKNNSVVNSISQLKEQVLEVLEVYHQPALIEEYLIGREFTVALLGNRNDLQVLPIVEIKFDALPPGVNPIFSYEAKWIWDQVDHPIDIHQCPANLNPTLKRNIEEVCKKTYNILRCRDWTRIDVRLDTHGIPNIIELNPLPGILPDPEEHSCFPQAARAAGLDYNQLINSVLDEALKRYGIV